MHCFRSRLYLPSSPVLQTRFECAVWTQPSSPVSEDEREVDVEEKLISPAKISSSLSPSHEWILSIHYSLFAWERKRLGPAQTSRISKGLRFRIQKFKGKIFDLIFPRCRAMHTLHCVCDQVLGLRKSDGSEPYMKTIVSKIKISALLQMPDILAIAESVQPQSIYLPGCLSWFFLLCSQCGRWRTRSAGSCSATSAVQRGVHPLHIMQSTLLMHSSPSWGLLSKHSRESILYTNLDISLTSF